MMVDMVEAAHAGDYRAASRTFRRLLPLFDACFVESNPIPVKAALSIMGICTSDMRLPLTTATPATETILRKVISELSDNK